MEPVERYLAWLTHIERSPSTVRAYALDLKAYFSFLAARGVAWDAVTLELLGEFTAWLRQPADNVLMLPTARPRRSTRTVNRMLSAVAGFYEYHARNGLEFARALTDERRSGRGSYKPLLHGIARSKPRGRVGRLREERRLPRTLTPEQMRAVIHAQRRYRDRFLFALLALTGMRVGQALGLRHEDVVSHARRIEIVPREDNANGARAKGGRGSVPIGSALVRLHSDYMHEEYGALDSDYVFVNLWGGRLGRPLSYASVDELVRRTRRRVGFHFTPHILRHSYATLAARRGVPLEVLSRLLTHRSLKTTSDTYLHPSAEDLRAELERAGVVSSLEALL
ncbi:MAG: site-specific integrase [Actinobacteria bacterium]|nr:site-specific integrase [Actinomycetota bacterium]